MRNRYDKQLLSASEAVVHMGFICTESLTAATQSLLTGEMRLTERAALCVQEAERQCAAVNTLCESIIMQQQPVAQDLRAVMAAGRIAADLRRITSQGSGIAEIIRKANARQKDKHSPTPASSQCSIAGAPSDNALLPIDDCRAVAHMADAVIKMVQDAVSSYEVRDRAKALSVQDADAEVDSLFRDARAELVSMMTKGGETQDAAECALDFMLIAKYLERAGDHAVSVASAVLFLLGDAASQS